MVRPLARPMQPGINLRPPASERGAQGGRCSIDCVPTTRGLLSEYTRLPAQQQPYFNTLLSPSPSLFKSI